MSKTIMKVIGVKKEEKEFDREALISEIGAAKLKEIYTNMVRTRALDEKIEEMLQRGYSILQHSTLGQEATPAAACACMKKTDYLMPYHRGWGWAISKGMDSKAMMAEFLGKKTGTAKGKGGVQLGDWENRVMGRPGIQGAHLSIGAGVGLAAKMRNKGEVVISFNGDGSTNTCNFYEGINLAAVWQAPVVYIVENNGYSITQKQCEVMKVEDVAERAVAFNIPGFVVDGNDAVAVYKVVSEAVARARRGEGPTLIEAKTYRLMGHHAYDRWHRGGYRSEEEIESWREKCPVDRLASDMIAAGFVEAEELEAIKENAAMEMEEAARFAIDSPYPTLEELIDPDDLYA